MNTFLVTDRIVSYIPSGKQLDPIQTKAGKLQVWASRQEPAFLKFSSTSPQTSFVNLATTDSVIRIIPFLDMKTTSVPHFEYPIRTSFPLFLQFDESFISSLGQELLSKQVEELRKTKASADEDAKTFGVGFLGKYFEMMFQDAELRSRILSGRVSRGSELSELTERVMSRNVEPLKKLAADSMEFYSKFNSVMEEEVPLLNALGETDSAIKNKKKLSYVVDLVKNKDLLESSLSKLAKNRIFRIRNKSLCLECRLKAGLDPYSIDETFTGKPAFREKCDNCNGISILHTVQFDAEASFGPLLNEHLLQEFVVGNCLARCDAIEKVFIHKKVQKIEKTGAMPTRQVDVLGITKDGRVLVVEVTVESDWNHIMEELPGKEQMREVVPYDYLFYVTSAIPPDGRYLGPFDTRNSYVFGVNHIPKFEQMVSYILDGKKPA